jgi:hypothetical protein
VLFTFPSRYWFTIGRRGVFSLGSWSTRIPTGFHVPRGTRELCKGDTNLSLTGLSPSSAVRSRNLLLDWCFVTPRAGRNRPQQRPSTPVKQRLRAWTPHRFGLFRVRSPLLTESLLLSLPGGTEMVHFPPLASTRLCVHLAMTRHDPGRVAPFGYPRIKACLRLPEAFRSLPRPSSPLCAKASTVYP